MKFGILKKHHNIMLTVNQRGLFTEYINKFLKLKQESSGWPDNVKKQIEKDEYIASYFLKEGIQLNSSNIKKNPGLRAVSMLLSNSLWGKLSQNEKLKHTVYIHDSTPSKLYNLIGDITKNVINFHIINDYVLQVEYENIQGFAEVSAKTNIFIGCFVTSHARITLYNVLDQLSEAVIYMDTDSVVFKSKNGFLCLQTGPYLGNLTSEISPSEGGYIVQFVSGGPKNYAYKTPTNFQVCKIKGFSLNSKNRLLLNFDELKNMIVNETSKQTLLVARNKISRNKTHSVIYNQMEQKIYKFVL